MMGISVHVIIPVRDMAADLAECLDSLRGQLSEHDRLTVVDDGSSTPIEPALTLSAQIAVERVNQSQGPYGARHQVARESTADVLLFVDARCRARPGLVAAHRRLMDTKGTALSCTGTLTRTGPSLAARVSAMQQPFQLDGKVGTEGRLDFYPTANLGVRRSAYSAVGGFRDMRSGADADLCWRIQLAGLGGFAVDPAILMEWVPRTNWRSLDRQWSRYGESTAYLEHHYPTQSPAAQSQQAGARSALVRLGHRIRRTAPSQWPVLAGAALIHVSFTRSYRRAMSTVASVPAPTTFTNTTFSETTVSAAGVSR